MKLRYLVFLAAFISALFLVRHAEAVPITSASDIPAGPDTKYVNFDGLSVGVVDTQYSYLGVAFSGGAITFLAPDQVLSVDSAITATFGVNVNMVGLDFSSSTLLTLEAYDASNNLIESVTATTLNGFFGLSTGSQMISYVVVHDHGFGFAIDNFTFVDPVVPVPEPATLMLIGSGLTGLGLVRRRFSR